MVNPLVGGRVGRMAHDAVQVLGDRADVLGDAPFVVIQNDNQSLGGGLDVVQRFVGNAVGESSVTRDANDILVSLPVVARGSHNERSGKRRAGVARAKTVVLALGAERET